MHMEISFFMFVGAFVFIKIDTVKVVIGIKCERDRVGSGNDPGQT